MTLRPSVTPSAHLDPGDPVAGLALADRDGNWIRFADDQRVAGFPTVFWVTPVPDAGHVSELAAMLPVFAGMGAAVYVVSRGGLLTDAVMAKAPEVGLLYDPDGTVARAFGLTAGMGMLAFDANFRLYARFDEPAFAAAATAVREMVERAHDEIVHESAPVLIVPQLFDPAMCARLMDAWRNGKQFVGRVSDASQQGRLEENAEIKRRTDVAIEDGGLQAEITELVARRVFPEMEKAFDFVPARCETFRIGCYDSADAGFFLRHRDNTTARTRFRKFALTVNLNTGDYDGGDLQFPEYGRTLYAPDAGGAIVFNCSLLHEVKPVTRGRRFGIFSFMYDQDGFERGQALLRSGGTQPG